MDNFNKEINDILGDVTAPQEVPNTAPASELDGDEATDERQAIPGEPPVESGFKLVQDAKPAVEPQAQPVGGMNQPQFGQPMGGMNQPQFGQPMGGMNQPQFGQPMGGMNQPQFGQPMGGMNQPQFGQTNQQMYGANPYGQPMGGMNQPPVGGKPPKMKKPKKPLSKGAIGGIIGGGVALIALIVCAIIFLPKLFPTDKEVVVDAFEATFGIEAETEDILGSQEIADKFATTGGHREVYVELSENVSGEVITASSTITEDIDVQNKLANTNMTVGFDGTNVLSANMIVDETYTYFQLPDLVNGYFTLPNENIFQALENSELGQAMDISGMPEMNMGDMYFNLATSTATTELNSEYVAIMEKLWDSITYEKQGKAKIDVNGKTVTAKEYFVTLPEKSAKDAIGDLWDATIAEMAADPMFLEQMGMDAATFESAMGSYSGMLKGLISGDLVIKVYIVDDEIVKIACADDIKIYGVELNYDMFVDIDDEKVSGVFDFSLMDETVGLKFDVDNVDESPSGKISLYAAGEYIDVNFSTVCSESGSKESCDLTFDVVYNGTTYVDGTVKTNVDTGANSFDGSALINVTDAGEVEFTFAGGLKDVKKGEAYTIEFNNCEIIVDGISMFSISGYTSVDTSKYLSAGIDSSLPVYDITTLTETDFEEILMLDENVSLVETWAENFSNALGIDITSSDPVVEEPEEPEEPDDGKWILEGTNKSVEILGTIPGFEMDMESEYYVYFETEEWSYVEYMLYEGFTPEECVAGIYVPQTNVLAQEMGQTMELEGETIYYSYVQDNEYGFNYSAYMFAKDLGDGTVLVVDAGIYDDDDSYTKEQLVQALSSQYYKVVQ